MILSVSRRTDVPRYYFGWFLQRLAQGYALTRNPMNHAQLSRVPLTPEVLDFIVFWSKDPAPMLPHLARLAPYPFYIQYTLNAYGPDIEPGLAPPQERLATFKALAAATSPAQVVWRYSPVLLNGTYTARHHLDTFARLAKELEGHTLQCRLSFLDLYPKIAPAMSALGAGALPAAQKQALAREFAALAARRGIALSACCDGDLRTAGIPQAKCVDDELIAHITGRQMAVGKDPGQRTGCGCVASVDIGAYNCCVHGCAYCYANQSPTAAQNGHARYREDSPLLCGTVAPGETAIPRAAKSLWDDQLRLY